MCAFDAAVYVAVDVAFSSHCCCDGVDSKYSLTLVQAYHIKSAVFLAAPNNPAP